MPKVNVNIPATGAIGSVPPPDAPIESAAPLRPETIAHLQARASENEVELKPFAPPQRVMTRPQMVALIGEEAVKAAELRGDLLASNPAPVAPKPPVPPPPAPSTASLIADVFGDPQADLSAEADHGGYGSVPALTPEDRQRMPAASEGDTPSKGLLPTLVPPKGDKEISGGFMETGDAQYFPMSGDELRELVIALCDNILKQVDNDLRFSLALTYPRVRARVVVEIEGAADDNNAGFVIERIHVPKLGDPGSTPGDIARQRADTVVFVVKAERQEVTDAGESDTPPDQFRAELGLPIPRKAIVTSGGRESFVDTLVGADVAAVTR